MKSSVLNWNFVSVSDVDVVYSSVQAMKRLFLTIAFLLTVTTILLSYFTCRSMYNPIFNMIQYIKLNVDPTLGLGSGRPQFGEMKMIRHSLMEAFEDRKSLQVRLKESLPAFLEKFIRSLLHDQPFTSEQIKTRLRALEVDLDTDDLIVLQVLTEQPLQTTYDLTLLNRNKTVMMELLGLHFRQLYKTVVVELTDNKYTVILNCHRDDFLQLWSLSEQLVAEVKVSLDLSCTIGIGNYCTDVTELKRGYEEAEEALSFRSMTGDCEIIYIEDVRLVNEPSFTYPKDKDAALAHFMKNGDTEEAIRVFTEIMKHIGQDGRLPYRHLHQAFVQLLISFCETANSLRLDLQQIMHSKTSLFTVLLHKNNLEDIQAWFEHMIITLTGYIGDAFQEKNRKHIGGAIAFMEAHCGDNISLTELADRLNLSPSYLSRIFKESTGQTFLEYLTVMRIERSKKLLLETDMLVKDICSQLGYQKVNYFIKLFKEFTGTTPGEFRKIHVKAITQK
jgi:YesN/AraC family two-component response regulator